MLSLRFCINQPDRLRYRQHLSLRHYYVNLTGARERLDKLTPLEKVGRGDSYIRSMRLSECP